MGGAFPPGWYEDPSRGTELFWWDGRSWFGVPGVDAGGRADPGWYADPWQHAELRWFDGTTWGQQLAGAAPAAPATTGPSRTAQGLPGTSSGFTRPVPQRTRSSAGPAFAACIALLFALGLFPAGQYFIHWEPDHPLGMEEMGGAIGMGIFGFLLTAAAVVCVAVAVGLFILAAVRQSRR